VGVELPVSTAKPQLRPDKPIFLTLRSDLSLALGNEPVARSDLGRALDAATQLDRQQRLFLRADKTVPYGEVMLLMNTLRSAGYLKIALVGLEAVDNPGDP
jgi:biopolymer transport protein ExbD